MNVGHKYGTEIENLRSYKAYSVFTLGGPGMLSSVSGFLAEKLVGIPAELFLFDFYY